MQVKIDKTGWVCSLRPWVSALEPLLTYKRREGDFTPGRQRKRATYVTERIFEVRDGVGVFPAGLLSRVVRRLKELGYTADVSGTARELPPPDFAVVEQLRPGQEELLLSVAANEGGLLVGGTGTGKGFVIRQICRMYPQSRIVVISPRRAVVRQLYEDLTRSLLPGSTGLITGEKKVRMDARVVVTTVKSMPASPLQQADIVLFDEVHAVGDNQATDYLAYAHTARRFGFTASPVRGDGTGIVMEAMFGPVIAEIPYDEAVRDGLVVQLEVHMLPVGGSVAERELPVANKRWAYWRNGYRNRVIADTAKLLPADEQVLIMTETLEHARNLQALLPDYALVHYSMPGKELDRLRHAFAAGELRKVIATTTWKEGVDFPQLSVLIRADGAPGEVSSTQIPGRLSRISAGKDVGVLIDFMDEFNGWAKRRSQQRMSVYRRKSWEVHAS